MEHLASVSRSGGYGDSGDALKDHAVQERYFAYIASVKEPKARIPLFRKLREGVVASHRDDDFARRAFGESVHCAIAAKDIPQLYAALNGTMALYGGKQADTHFTTLLLLYHLVHSPRPRYQAELDRCGVHPPFVLAAARVLAPETFDPRAYFIMVGGGGTARERIEKELLGWAAPRVREQALEMLRKAYMSTSVAWAVALLGGEEAIDGLKVENGVVKLR